jgi:acetoin utilization deacetylase AcuC-like enzyme
MGTTAEILPFFATDGVMKMDRWLFRVNSPLHRSGIACIRPPGHHAEPDRAMGFCLFNNVALGAAYLKHRYCAKKILIADMDIHHGNCTQKAFYDGREVLYFSAHQFP